LVRGCRGVTLIWMRGFYIGKELVEEFENQTPIKTFYP
jgi:hypothetical protein